MNTRTLRQRLLILQITLAMLTLAVCMPSSASCRKEADIKKTEALLGKALGFYGEARYDEAISALEEANDICPTFDLVYNIALCHQKAKRLDSAKVALQRAMKLPDADETKADKMLAELEADIEAWKALDTASATLAEEGRTREALNKAREALEIQAHPQTQTRIETLQLKLADAARRSDKEDGQGLRIAGWATGAFGLVSIGAGLGIFALNQDTRDELDEIDAEIAASTQDDALNDRRDKLTDDLEEANIVIATAHTIGAIALVSSAVLLYMGYTTPEDPEEASDLQIFFSPTSVGISGSF